MTIESLLQRKKPHRKIEGIAAALLPYRDDGKVAVDEFQRHLVATQNAGLQNAVNMDTGYVNYLSDAEKSDVLRWTREALGPDTPFVAGASQMTFKRFQFFNVAGAFFWVLLLVLLGYFFGNIPFIRQYLNVIVLVGIGAAVVPVVLGALWKMLRKPSPTEAVRKPGNH